jgi:hypothetical protein
VGSSSANTDVRRDDACVTGGHAVRTGSLLVLQHKSVYTLGSGTKASSGPFGFTASDGHPLVYESVQVDRYYLLFRYSLHGLIVAWHVVDDIHVDDIHTCSEQAKPPITVRKEGRKPIIDIHSRACVHNDRSRTSNSVPHHGLGMLCMLEYAMHAD